MNSAAEMLSNDTSYIYAETEDRPSAEIHGMGELAGPRSIAQVS